MQTIKINGRLFTCLTITELAERCDRSVKTFYKYEERGILPNPNIRTKAGLQAGKRLYTTQLADKLSAVFKNIQQGVEITDSQKQKINLAFQEEREEMTKPLNPISDAESST